MKRHGSLLIAMLAVGLISTTLHAYVGTPTETVFVMSNATDRNEVISYQSIVGEPFHEVSRYATGGRGSGGKIGPLESQGSLVLSQDHSFLFAVNAGSGDVSVFRVSEAALTLVDKAPSGGSEPVSIAQRRGVVYVLNQGGAGNIVGFKFSQTGHLTPIPHATAYLSANLVAGEEVSISPDGRFLVAIEQLTDPTSETQKSNNIDTFRINPDGTLGSIVTNAKQRFGSFSSTFTPDGKLIVSETGSLADPVSGISSYTILADGTLSPITQSFPTLGAATCWVVLTPDAKRAYTANFGSSNISGFSVGPGGVLSPIAGTLLASNPPNSFSLDIAVSSDGKYVFNLNPGSGTIGVFVIESDGTLNPFGNITGLPISQGHSGIAAL